MAFYLAKKQLDQDGNLTGYRVGSQVTSRQRPNQSWDTLFGPEGLKYKKAEQDVDGIWVVVEDTAAKDAADTKRSQRETRKSQLRAANAVIDGSTLEDPIKTLLKRMVLEILRD